MTAPHPSSPPRDPYRALFEQSADAILIIDGDTFVDCNQATVDMLRYASKDELLRTHPSVLSPPTQPDGRSSFEKANDMIALAFERGSHRFEWDHVRADGEVFPVEVLLTPVPEGPRTLLHVVWRDITERKRLETDLRQAQKMEAIGKLAGGIAHDFNNLLVAIIGNSEILQEELAQEPERAELVDAIRLAADRASDLTRQLLAFSRKQVLQPKVIDLNRSIEELHKLLVRIIGERVTLDVRLHEEHVAIHADPGQLEQIVVNLVANARDAMPDGGRVLITTGIKEFDTGALDLQVDLPLGRYAHLVISDDGPGMSPDVADRVFDPFFTTKELHEGTGLGLSTVYGIVKQSQGDIFLRTEPGRGSAFEIFLPLSSQSPVDTAKESRAVRGDLGGEETILVVEDEEVVSDLVAHVLGRSGYQVRLCRDGREALEAYRRDPAGVDLILTDVVMPGLGGPELIEALEADGHRPRVLFASGYMDGTLRRMEAWRGDFDLLAKPFSVSELLRRVRGALDRPWPD